MLILGLFLLRPNYIYSATTTTAQDSDGDGFSDEMELQSGHDPYSTDSALLSKTIHVSIKDQRLQYFTGKYLVKEIKVSTGVRGKPTPRGSFVIEKKIPIVDYKGVDYDFPNTKWNMRFKFRVGGSYYIHGAYWHHNFGHPMSHGCVNVAYADIETLYNWAPKGTPVFIE